MEKKVIFAALGGAIAQFLVGGLVFGLVLKSMMDEMMKAIGDCANPNPNMLHIALANLSISVLLAISFSKFNVSTLKGGLLNGLWMGALILFWFDLWMFATFHFMTINMFVFDMISNTTLITISGGIIGWILGKVK